MTLLDSSDESDEEHDPDHEDHGVVDFEELQWHVILGICLVSTGLSIVLICILWSCIRKHCSGSVPKKIGGLKVIIRQPSGVSVGDAISNQRTWVTTTSMSNLRHPSIFQVLPSLQNPTSKENTQPKDEPPSYESTVSAQAIRKKKLERFLSV